MLDTTVCYHRSMTPLDGVWGQPTGFRHGSAATMAEQSPTSDRGSWSGKRSMIRCLVRHQDAPLFRTRS